MGQNRRIICFGDSLTWGYDPKERVRFDTDRRWPMVMQKILGEGESHTPFDILIIMLGINDCKRKFAYSPMDIAGEMQIFLEKVQAFNHFRCKDSFKVLLVSPPPVSEAIRESWLGDSFGFENSVKVSKELVHWYKSLADMYGCEFLDAAEYVKTSDADGVHLDAQEQRKLGGIIAERVKGMCGEWE